MKKNYLYNLIYQILILILPIITVPYVSRCLGADGVGQYSFTYSIAYYFMIFALLGINNHGNRTIAKSRETKESLSKSFWSLYLFQLISSGLALVIYLAFTLLFMQEYKTIALIQSLYVLSCMFDVNWFFFGTEKLN